LEPKVFWSLLSSNFGAWLLLTLWFLAHFKFKELLCAFAGENPGLPKMRVPSIPAWIGMAKPLG
jgi:hypothetical protein